jgi:hypothetical protein
LRPAGGDHVWRPPRGRYRGHRHERLGVPGAALAQWTDRASATGKAAGRRAGGTAVGTIDAMLHRLDLLRGQVTREIRQAGDAPR